MAPDLERQIRNTGRNLTKQRRAVLDALRSTESHPTALDLFDMVREQIPDITLATVYRNLGVLQQLGLAQELGGEFASSRYDARTERHPHVRCVRCGRTDDIDCEQPLDMEARVKDATDFVITGHSLIFEGICPDCRRRDRRKKKDRQE